MNSRMPHTPILVVPSPLLVARFRAVLLGGTSGSDDTALRLQLPSSHAL